MGKECSKNVKEGNICRILVGKSKRPLRRKRQGGWIMLKLILQRYDVVVCTGLI
jgi:hypothetical protein